MILLNDVAFFGTLFGKHRFTDYRWIDPRAIVVSHWVRMKCLFGCPGYGRNACCPPHTPSVAECREFFSEYRLGALFHFQKSFENPEERHAWTKDINQRLLHLERDVFLAGNPKAFLLFMDSCGLCEECAKERVECKNKISARPPPEAMAVDVFSTARQASFPIEVLSGYTQSMNRYSILLIE